MGWERDGMRPVLDKAFVVNGLEEFTIDERRRRVERAGMCWFCGAHGGCENCGTGEGVHGRGSRKEVLTGFKRDRYQADIGRAKGENKRAKLEHARNSNMAPSSMASGPDFQQELVDPSLLPFQKYNLNSRAFRYNHFRQSAPNFDYQPQEAKFQAPAASMIPPTSTGRQGVQDLQSQVINAGYSSENAPVDPSLEGPPGIEQQHQSFDLPLHQKQEFPPLPEFGGDSVSLIPFHMCHCSNWSLRLISNSMIRMMSPLLVFWQAIAIPTSARTRRKTRNQQPKLPPLLQENNKMFLRKYV